MYSLIIQHFEHTDGGYLFVGLLLCLTAHNKARYSLHIIYINPFELVWNATFNSMLHSFSLFERNFIPKMNNALTF
jgi:hypothetical protein